MTNSLEIVIIGNMPNHTHSPGAGDRPLHDTETLFLLKSMETRDRIASIFEVISDFARVEEGECLERAGLISPSTGQRWIITRTDNIVTGVEEFSLNESGEVVEAKTFHFGLDGMTEASIPYKDYTRHADSVIASILPPEEEIEKMDLSSKLALFAEMLHTILGDTIEAMPLDIKFNTKAVPVSFQEALLKLMSGALPFRPDLH